MEVLVQTVQALAAGALAVAAILEVAPSPL